MNPENLKALATSFMDWTEKHGDTIGAAWATVFLILLFIVLIILRGPV